MDQTPEIFEPGAESVYTLEAFVRITGLPRRSILVYCRSGLLRPHGDTNTDGLHFDDECVRAVRQIELLREHHGISLNGVKIIFDLLHELEATRAELRFLRGH